jgi:hypothetical protein
VETPDAPYLEADLSRLGGNTAASFSPSGTAGGLHSEEAIRNSEQGLPSIE